MPEPIAAPQAAPAPKPVTSASEYMNRTDEEIEASLGLKAVSAQAQTPAPPPAEPAAEVVAAASEEVVEAVPEAPTVAPAPVPPPPKPLTQFVVKDAEGELDPPLELRFSFKANDKQYADIPLDKVVKMAQMGYYNEEREQQVLGAKQFVAEAESKIAAYEARLAEIDTQVARFMADEAFRTKAIELFHQQNSPEARATRAEQQVQQLHAQTAKQAEQQKVATFVQTELTPRISKLLEEHPTVSPEEVIGHYTMLTAPLLVNGIVPPQRFPEVSRLIDTDLRHWVDAKHDERTSQQQTSAKQTAAATLEVAKAKRMVARRTAPPSVSAPAQAKSRKFTSATEWLNAALPNQSED